MKEIHLPILKHLPEGQGSVGISSGTEVLANPMFALSLSHASTCSAHRHSLTKAKGMSCSQWAAKAVDMSHHHHSPTASIKQVGKRSPLVARKACIPGPHETITIGKTVLGRISHPGHCTDSRWKHKLSACEKKHIYLCWSFNLRCRLQDCHTARGYRDPLREHREGHAILHPPLASSQPTHTSQKGAYILI